MKWERGEEGEESEWRTGRVWRCVKWECTKKIAPKRNRFGIWDAPWGLLPLFVHFRKLFSGTTFPSQIVCLYLAPFKSYKVSKMTILKMSQEQCNVFF